MRKSTLLGGAACVLAAAASPAFAQHAEENATRAAGDAFGTNIGLEKVGLYTNNDVRGFNPSTAGNLRLEGLYFDFRLPPPPHLPAGSQVRVGLTAQAYPFPAPTGIIDYSLRPIGDKPYVSTLVQFGPNQGYDVEFDRSHVLVPGKLGIAWGFNFKRDEDQPGDHARGFGASFNGRWRPTDQIEIKPWWGYFTRPDKRAAVQIFAAGPKLPAQPVSKSFEPDWSEQRFHGYSTGVLGSAALTPHWTLRAGVMRFGVNDAGPISDSFLNTDANGLAQVRRFANTLPFVSNSNSGEARLSGVFRQGSFEHVVHLSLRARDVDRTFGGAAQVSYPNVLIGQYNAPPTVPNFVFGPQSDERIRQLTTSASYLLGRRNLGALGFGVQKIDYRERVTTPGRPGSSNHDQPIFVSGSLSLTPTPRLAFYGAFTQGLEEAPIAPDVAANAGEAPPAIHTKQREAGLRYVVTPKLRLVVGYFDVRKPYFNLDATRVWRSLGEEQHKGVEVSLTGEVLPGFNVVGGYVHMDPKVVGPIVDAGVIGPIAVGQPNDTVRANFDYRASPSDPWSFEGAVNYFGARPVASKTFVELGGKQPSADAFTSIDLGARYRFVTAGHRSTFRVQVQNAFDVRGWVVATSGGLSVFAPRRFIVSIATDW